jgi:hypothetical protein
MLPRIGKQGNKSGLILEQKLDLCREKTKKKQKRFVTTETPTPS